MTTVNERIKQVRKLMKERHIDVYYVPNEDDHLSDEYTAAYFRCKSFLSGFTGESGCVIITKTFAGLWTDGRYFTQAEQELEGTCITLMRLRQEGVPDPVDFLIQKTPKNGVLGFDGRVVSAETAQKLADALEKKNAKIRMDEDFAGQVWGKERPHMPADKLYVLPVKYTGEDVSKRIERVRQAMKEKKADTLILTRLEDPCWMLNIRGNDIESTPIAYAFAMVTKTKVFYYIDFEKISSEVKSHFVKYKISVRPYAMLGKDLATLRDRNIWADMHTLSAALYSRLDPSNVLLNEPSPIQMFRAVKNPVEIKNTIHAHVKDGVAVAKFIYWVKQNVGEGTMTEVSAQNYLYDLRAQGADYIEPSFTTICAYQANGAMMHYSATEENHSPIKAKGFLLVDSGGTYKDGTTDITRTIAVGKLTAEEKKLYTKVLKGHLDLMNAKFLYGTCGNNLDILARRPLWNDSIDYQCGTGHGVGHVLSVHEGPQSIAWGKRGAVPLEDGMIVTDEPGVYLPHKLGIRIENELLVTKGEKNFYGQWMQFQNLTIAPYEPEAIDPAYLDDEELELLNAYHKQVYETLSPFLNAKEKSWLRQTTKAIRR
ncbi:MAG: aminopeptidase P family protein [Solobacterium sp.]|nr:aminopeptidase P family protein [Solobacterium sp.]